MYYHGILAVGLLGGKVMLVDLNMDEVWVPRKKLVISEKNPESESKGLEKLLNLMLTSNQVSEATISPLQRAAVTKVMELSSLVRDCTGKQGQFPPSDSGAVVVSMQPVLSLDQLEVIMTRTEIVIKIAEILWQNLELSSVSLSCSSLLHRLISLARLGQVETVVAASLGGHASSDHSPARL